MATLNYAIDCIITRRLALCMHALTHTTMPPPHLACCVLRTHAVVCLQPNSCDDITPVSQPGVQFKCPAFREFDPAKAGNSWPNEERCCSKVRSNV